jgi:hypothetical protein
MLDWMIPIARRGLVAAFACIALSGIALSQDMLPIVMPSTPPVAATPGATPPPPAAPTTTSPGPLLSEAQLDQLVAPIALYPDPLLAQILMASTYPLEVVEAARWVGLPANRGLSGEALMNALAAQSWDPSVKALVAFPPVLENMSNELQWTQDLGNAFLAEPAGVMAAVQTLRHQALAAGTLKTTPQCECVVQVSGSTISILPAEPQDVRVPVYSPVVYGEWPYPAYPPDDFAAPVGFDYLPGFWIGFEPPVDLAFFGPYWGWCWIDWGQRNIAVGPRRYALALGGRAGFAGRVWVHNPAHRGGVRYADAATRARFEAARVAALTTAARSGAISGGSAAARSGDDASFAPLRSEAARAVAERFGAATVLRGGGAAFRGEGRVAPAFRGGPAFRGAPAFHAAPAFHGSGAPHFAMAGPHGDGGHDGGPGGRPH